MPALPAPNGPKAARAGQPGGAPTASRVKPRLRGVSHELAFHAALGAGAVLAVLAPARATLPALIYAFSLVNLLGTSALYHRVTWAPRPRAWMRRADHAAIFILIAGTYTAFSLVMTTQSRTMLTLAWSAALLGALQSLFWPRAPRPLFVAFYLAMGWGVVPLVPALHAALGSACVVVFILGGVFYTVGAIIYAVRRPDPWPAAARF